MLDHDAQMPDWRPDEVGLFHNRYKAWARNWTLGGLACIAAGVVVANGEHMVPGILLAALGGTFGLIFGFAFWFTARGAQKQLDRLRGGGYLARWSIDADRWWAWHRARESKQMLVAWLIVGMVALVGFLLAGMIWEDGDVEVARLVALATVVALPLTGFVIWLHKAPLPSPSMRSIPLLVGPHGALTVGVYLQWYGFGLNFVSAAVEADPPTLRVVFTVQGKHGTVEHTLELPVPPDRLDEAADAAAALHARVG